MNQEPTHTSASGDNTCSGDEKWLSRWKSRYTASHDRPARTTANMDPIDFSALLAEIEHR